MTILYFTAFVVFDLAFKIFISMQEASDFYGKPLAKNAPFWTRVPVWFPRDFWHWMKNLAMYSLRLSIVFAVLSFLFWNWWVTALYGLAWIGLGWFNPHRRLLEYWKNI